MKNRLKLKFITTNTILIAVFLTLSFLAVYISSVWSLSQKSKHMLSALSEGNDNLLKIIMTPVIEEKITVSSDFKEKITHSIGFPSYFIIYHYDDQSIYQVEGFENIDNEMNIFIDCIFEDALNASEPSGVLEDYHLRFQVTHLPQGEKIAFKNKNEEDSTLKDLRTSLLVIGVCSFALLLLVNSILAKSIIKPLERSLKQQKQLISDVSHELKTPVTIIDSNADLARFNLNTPDAEKRIEYIHSETKRLTKLIANILLLARSNESQEKASSVLVNISDIAYSVSLPFDSICFEKNRELLIDINSDLYVHAQESAIKQLFDILLDNACKYSNPGGVIHFRVYNEFDKVIVSVQNTGTPIPPDKLSMIFDRFYRVDDSRARSQGGFGLGLSIAKKIMEEHNGKIYAESNTKIGTVFTCVFKRVRKPPKHIDTIDSQSGYK